MPIAFLLNPAARDGRALRARVPLEAALRAAGLDGEVVLTRVAGDGERLARERARAGWDVVAVGGDGTVHEVVNGVAGTDATVGVLPLGTGNDFATEIGMPAGLEAGVRALAAGTVRRIDVGRVAWARRAHDGSEAEHRRLFANGLGAGFDALAADLAGQTKRPGGRAAYLAAVFRGLWAWRLPVAEAEVTVGSRDGALDVLFSGPLFLCEVGNGHSVGGGFLLTPDARPDDGAFDVCAVRHLRPARALRILPTAFSGAHVRFPEVRMARAERVVIRTLRGTLPLQADGEGLALDAIRIDVQIWPEALRVWTGPAWRHPPKSG